MNGARPASSRCYQKLGVLTPFDSFDTLVTSPVFSPFVLAILRLLFALYTLFTLVFVFAWDGVRTHTAGTLLSYFTYLSYIGLCAYFWAAGVQSLVYVLRKERSYPLQRWPRLLQLLHLLLFSTITTFPILVTIVFWAVLSSKSSFDSAFSAWSNISEHALNTVFCLFEIFLTHAGPTPWTHIPFIVFFLACYLGVAYITHATQGFYTYNFLDPEKEHAALAGWIVGIAVAAVVIFAVTRTLCVLRERVSARWARGRHSEGESIHSEQIDEWETIERPGSTAISQGAFAV